MKRIFHSAAPLAWLAVAAVLLLAPRAWPAAFSVTFDIQPRALSLGESATAKVTITGLPNAPAPSLPAVPGVDIQSVGTEQSYSFSSGAGAVSSIAYSFRVMPTKPGAFVIGPITYAAAGQKVLLEAIQIQVAPPGPAGAGGGEATLADRLFAVIGADRTNVFNQESFTMTISIYAQGLNLGRDVQLMNMPTTGLSLQPFQEVESVREIVDGRVFDVRRFRCRATALTAGDFLFAPTLRAQLLVQRERRRAGNNLEQMLDSMMFGGVEAHPVDVPVRPLTLRVRPIPEPGRPAGYSGGVGRFQFDVKVQPTEVNVGDPVNVTMTLAGEGNVAAVSAPPLALDDRFKSYEAKMTSQTVDDARGVGQKVFEQVVIPKSTNAAALPALSFTYFDPAAGAYRTLTRGPFALTVRGTSNMASRMVQAAPPPDVITTQFLGTDLVYLKPAPPRWGGGDPFASVWRPAFLGWQAAPLALLAALLAFTRRRDQLAGDVRMARRQLAPRVARSALARAERSAAGGTEREFHEAMWGVLASYFGHRMNLAPGEIARDAVLDRLAAAGAGEEDAAALRGIFDACEQARFTRGAGEAPTPEQRERMALTVEHMSRILRACERLKL